MKKNFCFSVLVVFACSSAVAQSIFDNPITGTNPNLSNPYTTGQTVNGNITASGIGRGSGIVGSNTNNRYNAVQWSTAAIDGNDYFEFTITPNPGIRVSFTSFVYTGQASANGPMNFAFRSSLDGYVTDIGSPAGAGTTIDLSAAVYQNISAAISFRFYGWAAITAAGTFSINDFTFNGVTGVLPITVEYFSGSKKNDSHILSWKVNCTNSSKAILYLERSADGNDFKNISSITADALRCLQPFEYADDAPLPGYNYYRLKMIDADGKASYSNKVVLQYSRTNLQITRPLPSVVSNTAMLHISAAQKMQVTIVVTDLSGRELQRKIYGLVTGDNLQQFDVSKFAAGVYRINVYSAKERVQTIQFIKQ